MKRLLAALLALPGAAALGAEYEPTLIGGAIRTRPAYEGSRSQVTDVIPEIRYYGKYAFARTTEGVLEGGGRIEFSDGAFFGAQVAYEAGPRGEDAGASIGVHFELDGKIGPAPFWFVTRLRNRLEHSSQTAVDVRLTVGVYERGTALLGLYAQSTWVTSDWTQDYYRSNGSGILNNRVGLLGGFDISKHWIALGSVEAVRLTGMVASSPFVQQRNGYYALAGVAYRFE